jgi:OmcA/MtrC family decaheme c-type cytochrome
VASATGVTPVVAKGTVSASGGLVRPAVLKKLVATGYTARRVVTDPAKCNSCHEQLGTDPNFHGGARNDPTACAICHNNTRTSNGWVANTSTFIHGIHGASKRTVPYMWAAVAADDNYSQIGYPGLLKDCNQCHLPSTVNFGATGGTSVATNLLWPTSATGKFDASTANTTAFRNSPYVVTDNATNYGNGFSYTPAGSTVSAYTPSSGTAVAAHVAGAGGETVAADPATLVNSPMASACFSCHDTSLAKAHMTQNGGAIYVARSSVSSGGALVNNETCLTCHAAGKVADAAAIHGAK